MGRLERTTPGSMLSEFELIKRYFTHPAGSARLGVGDDAALVRVRRGRELVISTDMLVSGRHFAAGAKPRQLGHKALAVNLSDMAAMGATPRWATLSLALPSVDPSWLRAFSGGFMSLARKHDVDLVGGDTTKGPLNICVQILGEVPAGRALTRDGARTGDDIWVSGQLGDAAFALAAREGRIALTKRELARAERRLHVPMPRVVLGEALRGVAHSAIDISDGLVADLGHICERSGVAAVVDFAKLPVSNMLRRHLRHRIGREALLGGGDDYELCFTAAPSRRGEIQRIGLRTRLALTCVGRVLRGPPHVAITHGNGRPMVVKRAGYEHFS